MSEVCVFSSALCFFSKEAYFCSDLFLMFSYYDGTHIKLIFLKRVVQTSQMDGLDDTNCTVASKRSKLSKHQKTFQIGYISQMGYLTQWVGQKGSETTGSGSEHRYRLYSLNILCRKLQNSTYFPKKFDHCFNFFCETPLVKSTERTSSGFKSKHMLRFFKFFIPIYYFSQISN